MAKPSDCRTMRDVMKSVFIRMAVILFWITIAILGIILFWHVSDLTFEAISESNFIKSRLFYYVIVVLSIVSIVVGIFMAICSFVTVEKESETVSITFLVFSVIGFAMPLIGAGIIAILSCYFPDNAVPETLIALKEYGCWYFMTAIALTMTVSMATALGNSASYY